MKDTFVWSAIAVGGLMILCCVEASTRALPVPYNNGALSYVSSNNDNDDIGLLLTVLLLATKGRGCGDCCCCNKNSGNPIPIPYPIPIPTNNPIINFGKNNDKTADAPDEDTPDQDSKQVVNVITKNDSDVEAKANTKNNVNSNSDSKSAANGKNTRVSR